MKIKVKLYLLILLPVFTLLFFVSYNIYETMEVQKNLEQVHTRVLEADIIVDIIEYLQMERALSIGFLVKGDRKRYDELQLHKQKTDININKWDDFVKYHTDEKQLSELVKNINTTRTNVSSRNITVIRAYQDYTDEILVLFDFISDITMVADNSAIKNELILHSDILYSMELMGQMRVAVYMILLRGELSHTDLEKLAITKEGYDTSIKDFLRNSPADIVGYYKQTTGNSDIQLTLKIVNMLLNGSSPGQIQITPDIWIGLSTSSIQSLDDVENYSLRKIEQDTLRIIDDNSRAINIKITLSALAVAIITIIALSAINNIITVTGSCLRTIAKVVRTKDFSNRIPINSNDEISLVGKSFNELLDIINLLIKEKEVVASTDTLTQTYNRFKFNEVLSEEIKKARANNTRLAFIMIDIDYFKKINDTMGHHAGDEVLSGLADFVRTYLRKTDMLARWGGEEFVILAPYTDIHGATELAEKLRRVISMSRIKDGLAITCSFGVTELRPDDTEISFCKRADSLLYRAKDGGRNTVCVD